MDWILLFYEKSSPASCTITAHYNCFHNDDRDAKHNDNDKASKFLGNLHATHFSALVAYSKFVSRAQSVDLSWTACDVMAQWTMPRWCTYWTASLSWWNTRQMSASVKRSICHTINQSINIFSTAHMTYRARRHLHMPLKQNKKSSPHDLDLGWGQGHISMHKTHRTTSRPNHVTVASSNAEVWLFEFRVMSTFCEV